MKIYVKSLSAIALLLCLSLKALEGQEAPDIRAWAQQLTGFIEMHLGTVRDLINEQCLGGNGIHRIREVPTTVTVRLNDISQALSDVIDLLIHEPTNCESRLQIFQNESDDEPEDEGIESDVDGI